MAHARDSITTTSSGSTSVIRELSSSFVQFLNNDESFILQSIEHLRAFSANNLSSSSSATKLSRTTNETEEELSIINSFKHLIEKVQFGTSNDDSASLVSLIMDILIVPCYAFYSVHRFFSFYFFNLFFQLLSHSTIITDKNYVFSIAVIISRSSIYYSKSSIMDIKKWTKTSWCGNLIGQNSETKQLQYKSDKFPFTPDSKICISLSDNSRFPIDITTQYKQFIGNACSHKQTSVDELRFLQEILNILFDVEFIVKSFLHSDECLLLLLSIAIQCQRICDIKIIDESNTQAQAELNSIKDQILNRLEYLPCSHNNNLKLIQSEIKVTWTDGKELIYHNYVIHPRSSFLAPLSKLFKYAYIQQLTDDANPKALWYLLLEEMHRQFSAHLSTLKNAELSARDLNDFFQCLLNSDDKIIRQIGVKFIIIFMNDLPISDDINLPPIITCSVLKPIIQSMINSENNLVDATLLNECLNSSAGWPVDDFCSLLTILIAKIRELSPMQSHSFEQFYLWIQFFVNLTDRNIGRLTSTIATNQNQHITRFCQQIQTIVFINIIHPSIKHSNQVLKFIIRNCKEDWIKVLLDITNEKCLHRLTSAELVELFDECLQSALNEWQIPPSFNLIILLIKSKKIQDPQLLLTLLSLLKKGFDLKSEQQRINIDYLTAFQSTVEILHSVFQKITNADETDIEWNPSFRQRFLFFTTSVILHLMNRYRHQFNTETTNIDIKDMKCIVKSIILLSIDYNQTLKLFNFFLQFKEHQIVIDYWLNQLIILALFTNEKLEDNEKFQCITSDEQLSSFPLLPTDTMKYFDINSTQLQKLLQDKLEHAIKLLDLTMYKFLSIFIQHSLSKFVQCLLHQNSSIRQTTACLIGHALNIQSNELTKLLNCLKGSFEEDTQIKNLTPSSDPNEIHQEAQLRAPTPSIYLLEREKRRFKSSIPFRSVNHSDFQKLSNHLKTLMNVEDNKLVETDGLDTREPLIDECPEEFRHLIPKREDFPALVKTKTMIKNRSRIIECIKTPIHLLLEGETGVGKSSLIFDVAADLKRPLVRLNLSSKTDLSGLFGSVKMKATKANNGDQHEIELNYEEGSFTNAYRYGLWLLLDEMNLAPPNVLQAIEQALESGVLIIPNIEENEANDSGTSENQTKENYRRYHPNCIRIFGYLQHKIHLLDDTKEHAMRNLPLFLAVLASLLLKGQNLMN